MVFFSMLISFWVLAFLACVQCSLIITGFGNGEISVLNVGNGFSFNPTTKLLKHTSSVTCLQKLDSTRLASGSADMSINFLNVYTGALLLNIPNAHSAPINAFELYTQYLLSGSLDGSINVWDVNSGEKITGYICSPFAIMKLKLYQDSSLFVGLKNGEIKGLNVINLPSIVEFYSFFVFSSSVTALEIMLTGELIASSADGKVGMYRNGQWSINSPIDRPITCMKPIDSNTVAFGSDDSNVYFLKKNIYNQMSFANTIHIPSSSSVSSLLVLKTTTPNLILVGTDTGNVHMLDANNSYVLSNSIFTYANAFVNCFEQIEKETKIINYPSRVFGAGSDGNIYSWNMDSNEQDLTLTGHTAKVSCLKSLGDGRLASGSDDNTIKIWDMHSGALLKSIQQIGLLALELVGIENSYLASSSGDNFINIRNIRDFAMMFKIYDESENYFSLKRLNNTNLAAGSKSGLIKIFNIFDGSCNVILHGHTLLVTTLELINAGTTLISGSLDMTVKIWNITNSSIIYDFNSFGVEINRIQAISDRFDFVIGGNTQIILFYQTKPLNDDLTQFDNPTFIQKMPITPSFATSFSIFKNRTLLISGFNGTIQKVNIKSDEYILSDLLQVTSNKNLEYALTISDVAVLESNDITTIEQLTTSYVTNVVTINMNYLNRVFGAASDGNIYSWNLDTNQQDITLKGHTIEVSCLKSLGDGRLASGSYDNTIKIWDMYTGALLKDIGGQQYGILALELVGIENNYLASLSGDGTIIIWDIHNFALINKINSTDGFSKCLKRFNDTYVVICLNSGLIKIINVFDASIYRILSGHTIFVSTIELLNDGTTLISSSFDMTVKIWNITNSSIIYNFNISDSVSKIYSMSDGLVVAGYLPMLQFHTFLPIYENSSGPNGMPFMTQKLSTNLSFANSFILFKNRTLLGGSDQGMVQKVDIQSNPYTLSDLLRVDNSYSSINFRKPIFIKDLAVLESNEPTTFQESTSSWMSSETTFEQKTQSSILPTSVLQINSTQETTILDNTWKTNSISNSSVADSSTGSMKNESSTKNSFESNYQTTLEQVFTHGQTVESTIQSTVQTINTLQIDSTQVTKSNDLTTVQPTTSIQPTTNLQSNITQITKANWTTNDQNNMTYLLTSSAATSNITQMDNPFVNMVSTTVSNPNRTNTTLITESNWTTNNQNNMTNLLISSTQKSNVTKLDSESGNMVSTTVSNRNTTLDTYMELMAIFNEIPIGGKIDLASFLNGSKMSLLLSSKLDLSNCIVNCSNNGVCKISVNMTLICECNSGYQGKTCQSSSSPCSFNPCLNNSTCTETVVANNSSGYECTCPSQVYYGTNCEFKIDLCENTTCSSNGVCKVTNDQPECECFQLYSGANCEIVSSQKKVIQTVVSTTALIAIIALALLYAFIVSMDLSKLFKNVFSKKPKIIKIKTAKKIKITKKAYLPS